MDTLRYSSPRSLVRRMLLLLGLSLLLLPLLIWLLRPGFWVSGDGLHHLYRVDELARYVRSGMLFPRWFGEFSFGYGAPVLLFYNPLSYYLALPFAPLGSLAALKAAMAASALLSAGAMWAYARRHAPMPVALLAALVYLYLPYRLVDLYVRAALAEHVAFIWFPLILLASDRIAALPTGLFHKAGNSGAPVVGFALAWAGLLLTHTFSAVMFAPFSVAYVLWLAWRSRSLRPLALAALGGLLAAGLSAFFWWPLLAEQHYAGLGSGAISTGYRAHLVNLRQLIGALRYNYATGALDPNYYYAVGLVPMALLILGLASAIWRKLKRPAGSGALVPESQYFRRQGVKSSSQPERLQRSAPLSAVDVALFGSGMAVAALFMCTQASQPIWDALAPLLANMQFPWRYLSIATLGISLGMLALPLGETDAIAPIETSSPRLYRRPQAGALIGGALVVGALLLTTLPALPIEPLPIAETDVTPESFWAFDWETGQAGSTWAGEFIPIWVTEQRWALGRPPETAQDGPAIAAPQVTLTAIRPDWIELSADHVQSWPLRYHAFYFPGWQVRVDGQAVDTDATGNLGLVTAEVPAGHHQVQIRFEATPVRTAARWVSLAAWALLVSLLAWAAHSAGRQRLGRVVLAGGLLLLAAVAWGGPAPRAATLAPATANLENRALLIGAYPEQTRYQPGDQAHVTLVWLALAQVARADKSFVHMLGPDGSVIAQHDGDPGGGYTPTTRWQPGEIILDRHTLALPSDLPPGRYPLRAGLYQFDPLRNLAVDPPTPDGRVDVGMLEVGS